MSRKVQTPGQPQPVAETDDAALSAQATADAGLPNAIDIDPKTIRGPVLTRQGWVCPDETGRRNPDSLKP